MNLMFILPMLNKLMILDESQDAVVIVLVIDIKNYANANVKTQPRGFGLGK